MGGIFIGNVWSNAIRSYICPRGCIATVTTCCILYVYCQSAKFTPLVVLRLLCSCISGECFCMVCIDIHNGWVFVRGLKDREWDETSYLRWLQYPLHHLVLVVTTICCPPCSQFTITIQHMAEELKALQKTCLS